jgi:carbon storage regulator
MSALFVQRHEQGFFVDTHSKFSSTKGKEAVMLVLSRKAGESIIIGGGVKLTVVEVRGDRVRIGFEGPREVPIHRQEVWLQIHNETAAAGQ